ncbi:MAG TPA: SRPBCC family protein [Kofleriaceae bacterium]|mgnify:CR=1 FL=1|nr:SRPBCC family protein [Kofleriaceae bacterium]
MITFSHSVEIAAAPHQVFALLDDLRTTPTWLDRCIKVEMGEPVQYHFRQGGGRVGVMNATIVKRLADQQLQLMLRDKLAEVHIDQRLSQSLTGPASAGQRAGHASTTLTCSIEVRPLTLAGKLMTPLIRKHLPTAIMRATDRIKARVEHAH